MARTWTRARDQALGTGLLDARAIDNARTTADTAVRAYKLSDVRKQQDVSQTALAKTMCVSQTRVSKIERGDLSHSELGTISAYVEALGGRLRVVADFGDQTITVE